VSTHRDDEFADVKLLRIARMRTSKEWLWKRPCMSQWLDVKMSDAIQCR